MIKLYKEYVEQKRLANVQTKIDQFKELDQIPYLSKRFILEKFLCLSETERIHNDKLWSEEQPIMSNDDTELQKALDELKAEFDAAQIEITDTVAEAKKSKKGLRGVGITQ